MLPTDLPALLSSTVEVCPKVIAQWSAVAPEPGSTSVCLPGRVLGQPVMAEDHGQWYAGWLAGWEEPVVCVSSLLPVHHVASLKLNAAEESILRTWANVANQGSFLRLVHCHSFTSTSLPRPHSLSCTASWYWNKRVYEWHLAWWQTSTKFPVLQKPAPSDTPRGGAAVGNIYKRLPCPRGPSPPS